MIDPYLKVSNALDTTLTFAFAEPLKLESMPRMDHGAAGPICDIFVAWNAEGGTEVIIRL